MRRAAFLACLVGCGGASAPPAHPAPEAAPGQGAGSATPVRPFHEQVLADMTTFTQRMCDCTDKACAQPVLDEFQRWGDEMEKHPEAAKPPPPELAPAFTQLGSRFGECAMRNLGAEDPNAANGPPASFQEGVLIDMSAHADSMCACTTKDCGTRELTAYEEWNKQLAQNPEASKRPSDEQAQKLVTQSTRFYDCMTKLGVSPPQ